MLISMKYMRVLKLVFPFVWFGGLALSFLEVFWVVPHPGALLTPQTALPVLLLGIAGAGVIGMLVLKYTLFDLADEVTDLGSALLVRKGDRSIKVKLADIVDISVTEIGRAHV